MAERKALIAMAMAAAFGGTIARGPEYEIDMIMPPINLPRKKRRKGKVLSETPFGPPSPFETRQQRRYRLRMEAKKAHSNTGNDHD